MSYSPVDHPLSPADGSRKRPSPANSSVPNTPSSIPPPTTPHATTFTTPERRGSKSSNGGGPTISRSIAACNRCRARKTRCDQQFPSCSACLKAQVHCVGIDAATGREIPRSYVDWLEKRVKHLEDALKLEGAHGVGAVVDPQLQSGWGDAVGERNGAEDKALHLRPDIENLVNQVGVVGVQGTSAQGFMGGTSGISWVLISPLLSRVSDVA